MNDNACFACHPSTDPGVEVAWQWHLPRTLCRQHTERLLTREGEGLFNYFARLDLLADVLEGSMIGRAINPVFIDTEDGRRLTAWAGYAAGTCICHEDRFEATNHFEARVMEFPDTTDLLYLLRHADPPPSVAQILADPLSAILGAFSRSNERLGGSGNANEAWSLAGSFWNEQRRFDDYLSRHTLSSAEDALRFKSDVIDGLRLAQIPQDMPAFTMKLFKLARRRFG